MFYKLDSIIKLKKQLIRLKSELNDKSTRNDLHPVILFEIHN